MQPYGNMMGYSTTYVVDMWDCLMQLKWYGRRKEAERRLMLIAEHFDNPEKLKSLERNWVDESNYYNFGYSEEHSNNEKRKKGYDFDPNIDEENPYLRDEWWWE